MTHRKVRHSFTRTRCLCGLRTALHFRKGRKLTCEQAALVYRYATIKFRPLRELMLRSVEHA